MKIITPGRLPEFVLGGRCDTCGCVFQLDQAESAEVRRATPRGGDPSMPCPTVGCGVLVDLALMQAQAAYPLTLPASTGASWVVPK